MARTFHICTPLRLTFPVRSSWCNSTRLFLNTRLGLPEQGCICWFGGPSPGGTGSFATPNWGDAPRRARSSRPDARVGLGRIVWWSKVPDNSDHDCGSEYD